DLAEVATSKQGKKITRADVEAHLASLPSPTNGTPPASQETLQTDAIVANSASEQTVANSALEQTNTESELIPLSPVRRLIGQRMLASISTAPHIYLDTEIDMIEIERARQRMGNHFNEQGEPVPSVTAFLIRATATALLRHPEVNATFEPEALEGKDAIRRWNIVNIGVAVDTEQALLTPVIKKAHLQSVSTLANELRRLSQAARQGTLKPDDLAGATFTISNLGMYGINTFHAIIAPGQGAILATGKITKRNAVIEDAQGEHLEIRPIMKVSLSADHRTIDGATGSRFLHQLKTLLENPYLLL
ncbi:MAG TPA: dihydrolipoamide acetyltransferase family protein, partial [Ktedonobacteraceae bacterium]